MKLATYGLLTAASAITTRCRTSSQLAGRTRQGVSADPFVWRRAAISTSYPSSQNQVNRLGDLFAWEMYSTKVYLNSRPEYFARTWVAHGDFRRKPSGAAYLTKASSSKACD